MSYLLGYHNWRKVYEAVTAYSPEDGITLAPGIDSRIDTALQNLVNAIQVEFGKPFTISSGYRDFERNRRSGGASRSAHLRNNAVDIEFKGDEEETVKFIEIASKLGAGGIGVYGPGKIHVDIEGRRAWGKKYNRKSVPEWAEKVISKHLDGEFSDSTKVAPTANAPVDFSSEKSVEIKPAVSAEGDLLAKILDVQHGKKLLKFGYFGDEVPLIKLRLNELGLFNGAFTKDFNQPLKQAVEMFQRSERIKIDGIVGPITFNRLFLKDLVQGTPIQAASQTKSIKSSYSTQKAANINLLLDEMTTQGVTEPNSQIGMLATIGKESDFLPVSEMSYRNTSNSRLRSIFGSRLSSYSDTELTKLKNNDSAFFDAIYGPAASSILGWNTGNTESGDGYKYRGRGFNQITFKNNYKKYGDLIGVDLVESPDLLNDPKVAAKAAVTFLVNGLKSMNLDPNSFADSATATHAYVQANAGTFKDMRNSQEYAKAIDIADNFTIQSA